ncbi:DUF6115 domain-containing protein [Alkalibacillus silvisoli]|uniref:Helix-turn-helix domain-containing protein n=1 Tax=Alkalibacillus silvisoli TaxID=392823 RepID=A0ABN0ZWK9_9BACI
MEIFNLILHGLTFIVIFWLYQKWRQSTELEHQSEQRVQEIEDLFNSYLLEIKDENKKLIEELSKVDQYPKQRNKVNEKEPSIKTKENPYKEPLQMAQSDKQPEENLPNYSLDLMVEQQQDQLEINHSQKRETKHEQPIKEEQTTQSNILSLYKEGHSIETIARDLNMGVTEVELIVKFNHKMTI